MNKVHWIIESITKEESYLELSKAVERAGLPLHNLRGDFAFSMVSQYANQPLLFTGCIQMCKLVNDYLKAGGNAPVIYCTWENYLCTKFYPLLSEFLFNDDYVMVPLKELMKRKFWFYGIFGKEACVFIRPNDGDKSFKGGVIDLQDFDKWYEPALENELAIISSPKNIRGEWRFVCSRHKEIIAQSSYRYQGLITRIPSAPHGATKLCQQILDVGYAPDSVFCVDIVECNDGNFWLMELNSFSSAGLYACNMDAVVKRVSEIALEDYAKVCCTVCGGTGEIPQATDYPKECPHCSGRGKKVP